MKSVTICGSARFVEGIRSFAQNLRNNGCVVYEPHLAGDVWEQIEGSSVRTFIALGLTLDHLYKIRMGDVIFIYNQNGYSGNSTTLEVGMATALDKPIYALSEKDEEFCRDVLFRGYYDDAKTFAEEILK